ncbi:uncharacterized protein LOC113360156 [Papaver somniferum]|uniref:uncharacterized protein LOC113360156 n=1 Tax=Papaver somniferum TaxID=3469 RepID=UPI000E6FAB54|nr:uncharacterized protein LOC113360156 [Papaver somniferum]
MTLVAVHIWPVEMNIEVKERHGSCGSIWFRVFLLPNKFREISSLRQARNWQHRIFAARAWNWIEGIFVLTAHCNLLTSYQATKWRSPMVCDLWLLANLVLKSELWALRNKGVFEQKKANWSIFYKRVLKLIQDYSVRLRGHMKNNADDVLILNYFRVHHKTVMQFQPVECYWHPPNDDEILLCCDGAARGNPGRAGAGVVARDAYCNVLGAMLIGLGITTNFLAELYGVIVGLEWAIRWGVRRVCIRSDSFSVVEALKNSTLPWFSRQRWVAVCRNYDAIRFVHTYREANFAADNMAKKGCLLENGEGMHYEGRSLFLNSAEYPNVIYYRFK